MATYITSFSSFASAAHHGVHAYARPLEEQNMELNRANVYIALRGALIGSAVVDVNEWIRDSLPQPSMDPNAPLIAKMRSKHGDEVLSIARQLISENFFVSNAMAEVHFPEVFKLPLPLANLREAWESQDVWFPPLRLPIETQHPDLLNGGENRVLGQ
jgi:hypothetical protein